MTEQTCLHEPSGLWLHRPVALPQVETWGELWDAWSSDRTLCWQPRYVGGRTWDGERAEAEAMCVGPLCVMSRGGGATLINVQPGEATRAAFTKDAFLLRGDRMTYRVIDRKNGWSLVLLHHQRIIGSRWLAYIRTESVPGELWPGGR